MVVFSFLFEDLFEIMKIRIRDIVLREGVLRDNGDVVKKIKYLS